MLCTLQIKPNGIITFPSNSTNSTTLHNTSTPKSLPIKDLDFIAPYWFDADILHENDCINYTETTNLNTSSFVNKTSLSMRLL